MCAACPVSLNVHIKFSDVVLSQNRAYIYIYIYNSSFLSCLFSLLPLFYYIPFTHHSSSHLPPLPPVSLSLFLCAHISVFPACLPVFFFLSMSVLILPHALLLLSKALALPGFCCSNTDTDKLFGCSFDFVFSFMLMFC